MRLPLDWLHDYVRPEVDVRELASAVSQLVEDTEGVVDDKVVEVYHGGKVEATGFRVADAAVAGQSGDALRLLRHAISTGVDPVPIVAVLASQLRQLVRVGSAGRGSSQQLAGQLERTDGVLEGRRRGRPEDLVDLGALGRHPRAHGLGQLRVGDGGEVGQPVGQVGGGRQRVVGGQDGGRGGVGHGRECSQP